MNKLFDIMIEVLLESESSLLETFFKGLWLFLYLFNHFLNQCYFLLVTEVWIITTTNYFVKVLTI
jgi:hypothetical protein